METVSTTLDAAFWITCGVILLLLVASGGLALAAGEAALALFGLAEPAPRTNVGERENRRHAHFVADAELGWRMRPGASFEWQVDGFTATRSKNDIVQIAGHEGVELVMVGGTRPTDVRSLADAAAAKVVGDPREALASDAVDALLLQKAV